MAFTLTDKRPSFNDSNRNGNIVQSPIFTAVADTVTIDATGDSAKASIGTINVDGILNRAILKIAENSATAKVALSINDEDGYEIFSSGEKAHNATHNMSIDVPVRGQITVYLDPEKDFYGTGADIDVKFYGE